VQIAGPLLDDGSVGINTVPNVQAKVAFRKRARDQVMRGGGIARYPALGRTAVAVLLHDRLAQTTAVPLEAQVTSGIDDLDEAVGGLRRHGATNDRGYYANQNADAPKGLLHGLLLCNKRV
jgi:hypothetical protein